MAFHEQSFSSRYTAMGDEAEDVFEEVCGVAFVRYGLDRPPIKVNSLDKFIRYTPDYLTSTNLVEVQGFGSDNKVKFKSEKLMVLSEWDDIMPLVFFIYHRQTDSYCTVSLTDLLVLLAQHGEAGRFNDGKDYTALHKKHLTWTHR